MRKNTVRRNRKCGCLAGAECRNPALAASSGVTADDIDDRWIRDEGIFIFQPLMARDIWIHSKRRAGGP